MTSEKSEQRKTVRAFLSTPKKTLRDKRYMKKLL